MPRFSDRGVDSSSKNIDVQRTFRRKSSIVSTNSRVKKFFTFDSSLKNDALKAKARTILKIGEKAVVEIASNENSLERRRKLKLKKVHFLLPKESTRRSMQSLDPSMTIVQYWLNIMILPLSYEMWAFPYRLALGTPSTNSSLFYTDASCDIIFIIDMLVSFITALPAVPGREEVTSFRGIAANYFTKKFPYTILPCCVYWCLLPTCARDFERACAGLRANSDETAFQCMLVDNEGWSLWLWWGTTLLRVVPRFDRLRAHFKDMESNLVRTSDHDHDTQGTAKCDLTGSMLRKCMSVQFESVTRRLLVEVASMPSQAM